MSATLLTPARWAAIVSHLAAALAILLRDASHLLKRQLAFLVNTLWSSEPQELATFCSLSLGLKRFKTITLLEIVLPKLASWT
jgi:hypothetical protein